MAENRPSTSLPDSQQTSSASAEHGDTAVIADPDGQITTNNYGAGFRQPHAQSADGSVTVEVAQSEDSNGPRRRVTVRKASSQPQQLSKPLQPSTQSADHVPGGEKQKQNHTFFGMIQCWLVELLAILLAAIVVVVLVVLLSYYHDRDVRDWNHEWAINSVFAFLTAIMEASVGFAISSCLGQLRWLWYMTNNHDDRELKWMDRLTNARSAPGAFRFAIGNARTAYRHTAFWGAALVIALLGVGVFTQNVITIRGQERPVNFYGGLGPAQVPIASVYENQWQLGTTGITPGDQMPLVPTIAAIQAGFLLPTSYQSIDQSLAEIVQCPSGNCTWASYSTLSLCWSCADISQQVLCGNAYNEPSSCPKDARTRLPDDSVSLDPQTGVVNVTADDQYPKYSNMTGIGPLVARYVGLGYWTRGAYATECALYWCVTTYNSSMEAFVFTETAQTSWTNLTAPETYYGSDWYIHLNPQQCYSNGTLQDDCAYGVDVLSQRALQNFLFYGSVRPNTKGFLHGSAEVPDSNNNGTNWIIKGLAANAIVSICTDDPPCNETFYKYFDLSFDWMAYYLSSNIREVGSGYTGGTETRFITYFHVRWGWLAYPIAIVLISFGFLVATMYKSRFNMPWKSSVMALLLHGIPDDDRKQSTLRLDNPAEMKEAENWVVTLQDHQGTRTFKVQGKNLGDDHHGEAISEGAAGVGIAVLEALDQANVL